MKKKFFLVWLIVSMVWIACDKDKPAHKQLPKDEEPPMANLPNVTAQKTTDFLESIGVNSGISVRSETLAKTIECIRYTGIRWIRSGYESNLPIEDCIALKRQCGTKFSYGLGSGGTNINLLLEGGRKLAAENALIAIEGPNEPNNWGITYNGEQGGRGLSWLPVAKLQRDLYAAVKADAVLKDVPVWSLSENGGQTDNAGLQYLTIPAGAGTLMPDGTRYADYANCHNYIMHQGWPGLHDNQTWFAAAPGSDGKVDGLYVNYGVTWNKKFTGYTDAELQTLPRVTTETGVLIGGEVTEEKHGTLLLNHFLAQFKRNWRYTAVYLLRDRLDEGGNQSYGFYKPDYSPRKAAFYLHNLTTILKDDGSAATSTLPYAIANPPETVHDLLLQNSKGVFQLVVWGEKLSGSDKVTINFGKKIASLKIFDPTLGTEPTEVLKDVTKATITVSDHPLILEL